MSGKLLKTITSDADLINVAANYITVEVPVVCGIRVGRVYIFSRKENLTNGLLENCTEGFKELVQQRKYFDSKNVLYDVGPTIAVANAIDNGEYAEFIKTYDKELTGLEHVIKVEEDGHSHHLMPECENNKFCMAEQVGLIQLSLGLKVTDNNTNISDLDLESELNYWPSKNENGRRFREDVLNRARVSSFEGYSREYSNCVIYKDLTDVICKSFNLTPNQIVEYQLRLDKLRRLSRRPDFV